MYNESYRHLRDGNALENAWSDFWECDFVAPGMLDSKQCYYEQPLMDVVGFAGIAMFWCYEMTYLLRSFLHVGSLPRSLRNSYTRKTTNRRPTFGQHPSHMTELALGFSFAIEYPLIVAYHPWTQYNGVDYSIPLLQPAETITQLAVITLVEEILKSRIMWFLTPCAGPLEGEHSLNGAHSAACGLTIDYLLPKATLWLGIMVMWTVYAVVGITGKLQMFPIVVWVVVRQFWGRPSLLCPWGLI